MSRGDRREDIFHDEESQRPGGVGTAARLRRETTLTMREIARRLYPGSWKSAATRLHSLRQKRGQQSAQSLLYSAPFHFQGVEYAG